MPKALLRTLEMPIDPRELDAAAKIIGGLVGLITVLSPFVNRFRQLKSLQFGNPGLFNIFAEVATLATFLGALYYRHSLHLIPPFWLWLALGLVFAILLFLLARRAGEEPGPLSIVGGLLLYTMANGALIFGLTQLGSEMVIFRSLSGTVHTTVGEASGVPVFVIATSAEEVIQTYTDSQGYFRFLLTRDESQRATEIRAKENERLGENWAVIEWDPNSSHYQVTLKVR